MTTPEDEAWKATQEQIRKELFEGETKLQEADKKKQKGMTEEQMVILIWICFFLVAGSFAAYFIQFMSFEFSFGFNHK